MNTTRIQYIDGKRIETIDVNISDMIGKAIIETIGGIQDSELYFLTECGWTYKMYHEQNCCESVYVEDITGSLVDLIGARVVSAEEISQDNPHASESGTWTFYKMQTDNWTGGICIRWNGESNGYYSESVSIIKYLTEVV